ncbi:MAG: DUF1844 domain-containing protein [Elusimicrobiota bacterium]|jgi:hypothetical protein
MVDEEQIKPGEADYRFLALVMSLATAAWSQLGKIAHPVSQKIEKDLQQAQVTIDFLRMLVEKTEGNLQPKENEMLTNVVSDLELNFADEVNKKDEKTAQGPDIILPSGAGSKGPEIIKP